MIESSAASHVHPSPTSLQRDDAPSLFRRSVALSVALHILLASVALIVGYMNDTSGTVTIQQIDDVSIVPLSALETQLQRNVALSSVAPQPPSPKLANEGPSAPTIVETGRRIIAEKAPSRSASEKGSETKRASFNQSVAPQSDAATEELKFALNGQAVATKQARIKYQDAIATLLSKAKRYPERALKRRITGEATVKLEINADGSLANFAMIRSTQSDILDDEVRAMVDRVAPFPAFPPDLDKESIALIVPIAFTLR